MEKHYLHEDAHDPDYEGVSAACDFAAGLEEAPRQATLASSIKSEVDCPDCISIIKDKDA